MPQTKSVIKSLRQSKRRRFRNVGRKRAVKVSVRQVLESAGDEKALASALGAAYKALDKAAQRGVIHKKAAARRKSRLTRHVNA